MPTFLGYLIGILFTLFVILFGVFNVAHQQESLKDSFKSFIPWVLKLRVRSPFYIKG